MKNLKWILFFLFSANAFAANPGTWLNNNRAVELIEKEKILESLQQLIEAVGRNPNEPVVHYNLGVIFDKMGETKKALQEYESIIKQSAQSEKNTNQGVLFQTLFNAAGIYGFSNDEKIKNVDKAIEYYQKALDINPESQEVKWNLELLLKDDKSGGGGGKNQNQQNKSDQKDQKDQQKPQDQPQENKDNQQKPKPTPQSFRSEQLSKQDVQKILEELKRQDEGIRTKMNNKPVKEKPHGKDW